MIYVRTSDATLHDLSSIRAAHANMSIPDGADLTELGYALLTATEPPTANTYHHVVSGAPVLVGENWMQTWQQVSFSQEEIITTLDDALTRLLNDVAHAKRYDSIHSAALRAGYPGPFQAEGLAYAQWMDACNATAYLLMEEVLSGARSIPTPQELIAAMPTLVLPS